MMRLSHQPTHFSTPTKHALPRDDLDDGCCCCCRRVTICKCCLSVEAICLSAKEAIHHEIPFASLMLLQFSLVTEILDQIAYQVLYIAKPICSLKSGMRPHPLYRRRKTSQEVNPNESGLRDSFWKGKGISMKDYSDDERRSLLMKCKFGLSSDFQKSICSVLLLSSPIKRGVGLRSIKGEAERERERQTETNRNADLLCPNF